MNLKDMLRAKFSAEDHVLPDKQKFDRQVCECCGHFRRRDEDPECVCDGLEWYLDKDGRVECQAHRFARAIGQGKAVFPVAKL